MVENVGKNLKKKDENLSIMPLPEITYYCSSWRFLCVFTFLNVFDAFFLITGSYNIYHLVLWFFHLMIDCKLMNLSLLHKINT